MKAFAIENTWLIRGLMDFGWGNGYVAIEKGHPFYGLGYDEIHDKFPISVHYGLTYANFARKLRTLPDSVDPEAWVIGFDTAHLDDSLDNWPDEESVMREANRLLEQCMQYGNQQN